MAAWPDEVWLVPGQLQEAEGKAVLVEQALCGCKQPSEGSGCPSFFLSALLQS